MGDGSGIKKTTGVRDLRTMVYVLNCYSFLYNIFLFFPSKKLNTIVGNPPPRKINGTRVKNCIFRHRVSGRNTKRDVTLVILKEPLVGCR